MKCWATGFVLGLPRDLFSVEVIDRLTNKLYNKNIGPPRCSTTKAALTTAKGEFAMADLSIPVSAPTCQIDRRIFMRSAMTTLTMIAAVGTPVLLPMVFDPVAYIQDMRAAGIDVLTESGHVWFLAKPGCGFGKAHSDVQFKWQHAMENCGDYNAQILRTLVNEAG